MLYTVQTMSESGSFAAPSGKDVTHTSGRNNVEWIYDDWRATHARVGSERHDASLWVWVGHIADTTDVYPDYIVSSGKRGGIIWGRA